MAAPLRAAVEERCLAGSSESQPLVAAVRTIPLEKATKIRAIATRFVGE